MTPPQPDSSPRSRRADFLTAFALALCCLLAYNANWRLVSASDNYPARYLPFAIIGHGTLRLDSIQGLVSQGRTRPYWVIRGTDHHLVSFYPIVAPLLVSPLYIPAVSYLNARGWTDARADRLARLMEKISASLVASLSVAIMYLALRRRADARTAALLAIAYGLGTNTWMIGSQGLWQHGTAELLLASILLLITGLSTIPRALIVGALCALAAFNRPPDAIPAGLLGLYALWWARRSFPLVMAGGVAVGIPLLLYNLGAVGHFLGGYDVVDRSVFFRFSMPIGIAGLLFSLGRGLFVFTPFLIALPLGLRRSLRESPGRAISILICIAFVLQLALYSKIDWRGGVSWGPRYLTDLLPLLVWMLPPIVAPLGRLSGTSLSRFLHPAFCGAVGVSIAIQAIGAFWYTGKSDEALLTTIPYDHAMKAPWALRNTPFILEFRHAHAPRDLLLKIDGGIDSVNTADGTATTQAPAGTGITIVGWALANDRTPWRVVVTLVPGPGTHAKAYPPAPLGIATTFQPRITAPAAGQTPIPCAWSIPIATAGLPPGSYVIETYAQAADGSEFHPLGQRLFKILPPGN